MKRISDIYVANRQQNRLMDRHDAVLISQKAIRSETRVYTVNYFLIFNTYIRQFRKISMFCKC